MPSRQPKPGYEYDPAKRKLAKAYTRMRIVLGLVNGIAVPVAVLLLAFLLGGGELLAGLGLPLAVLAVLLLLNAAELPLKFYGGYVYEHRYGLSRQNKRAWAIDLLKGIAIELVVSVPVLTAVFLLMPLPSWWVWAGLLYTLVDIGMNALWPELVLPLFYKLEPYRNRRLRERLLAMAREAGAKRIETVLVARESERSVKANALFAGIGSTKKIVLFDTLLDTFTEDEVETVIGHELGHYLHKDVWRGLLLKAVLVFPLLAVIDLVLRGSGILPGDPAGLLLFLAAFDVLELLLMPVTNAYSRRMERQADWFGLEASKLPEAQISTEKRLADLALSDNAPHPLVERWLYTHPAADKRVAMVEGWQRRRGKG